MPAGSSQVRQNNHHQEDASACSPLIPEDLIRQYRDLVRPERIAGHWHHQRRHPGPFRPGTRPLGSIDIRRVLEHRGHVAVRARDDGSTEQLAFDLDCEDDDDLPRRDALYWSIRGVMGLENDHTVLAIPREAE